MTNKEFFKTLNKEKQMEIVKTLTCYDRVHVEFYNGDYHITPNWTIRVSYPKDHKILNEFEAKEFDFEEHNYELEWYDFWNEKKRKGETNKNGSWQIEFENLWKPIIEKAHKKYIEA